MEQTEKKKETFLFFLFTKVCEILYDNQGDERDLKLVLPEFRMSLKPRFEIESNLQ